jgi:hypothetical protein
MPKFRLRPSNRKFRVLVQLTDGKTTVLEFLARAPNEIHRRLAIRKDVVNVLRIWEA